MPPPRPHPDPPSARSVTADGGFTLIELLVAASLFGVVLVAATGAFIASARSVGDQRLRTSVTRTAVDHLETLRALPFAQLDAQTGQNTTVTPDGTPVTLQTEVTAIDPETGEPVAGGAMRRVGVTARWSSRGQPREVSYTTAVAPEEAELEAAQEIGTITMFPSPATTDASGQPLQDIDVTVPLTGFPTTTLVQVSWTNADGTMHADTLISTTGRNWRGTIAREKITAAMGTDGRGELRFDVKAGELAAVYTLSLNVTASSPPVITSATIDHNPITVAGPTGSRTCADRNQCQNNTDVVFTVAVDGLDPSQDSVILQHQLYDGTFREVPLTPEAAHWQVTIQRNTTKFSVGSARPFRFTAIRSSDGATAATTVARDVVST